MYKTHEKSKTSTYKTWQSMKSRCDGTRPWDDEKYRNRGICVCERWKSSFTAFLEDMGERPKGLQIDRIDNDGNYEPGNCRWVSSKVNQNNKGNSIRLHYEGVTDGLDYWEEKTGISRKLLAMRYFKGWSHEKILTKKPNANYKEG